MKYSYYVSPTKIVDFFDDKISSGYILGKLERNNIITEEYFFKTEKGYGHFNFYGHKYFSTEISTFLELSYPQIISN